jgi:hypothetical protein
MFYSNAAPQSIFMGAGNRQIPLRYTDINKQNEGDPF